MYFSCVSFEAPKKPFGYLLFDFSKVTSAEENRTTLYAFHRDLLLATFETTY